MLEPHSVSVEVAHTPAGNAKAVGGAVGGGGFANGSPNRAQLVIEVGGGIAAAPPPLEGASPATSDHGHAAHTRECVIPKQWPPVNHTARPLTRLAQPFTRSRDRANRRPRKAWTRASAAAKAFALLLLLLLHSAIVVVVGAFLANTRFFSSWFQTGGLEPLAHAFAVTAPRCGVSIIAAHANTIAWPGALVADASGRICYLP